MNGASSDRQAQELRASLRASVSSPGSRGGGGYALQVVVGTK